MILLQDWSNFVLNNIFYQVQELGEGGHTEPGKPENPRKGGETIFTNIITSV